MKLLHALRVVLKFTWFSVVTLHAASEKHREEQAEINAEEISERERARAVHGTSLFLCCRQKQLGVTASTGHAQGGKRL